MRLRDFLERFRPTGTPGAAATGVPPDRAAERAAELAPALARLTAVQQEAARIRAAGDADARAIRREAELEAADVVAAAREQAPGIRRQAAQSFVQDALREAEAVRAAADRTADAVRRRGRARLPALVDAAVAEATRPATGTGPRP
ncbi:hypothetical protein ACIRQQ_39760 [Streptomyces fuscichromogenes]|uniref:hypothetical protein n=1 Tax=Streptomyces fuscichromogenes TaxID=1324013 RepID=UPI00382FBD6C